MQREFVAEFVAEMHVNQLPGGSDLKKPACSAGNPDSIPGLGRWERSLEEVMATHSSILSWRIPMDRGALWAKVYGASKSWPRLSD